MRPIRSKTIWLAVTLLSCVVAVASYRYLIQVGPVPPNVADNRLLTPWIVIHATASATALLVGGFQFLRGLRMRWPGIHRLTGRVYVGACLVGGVSAVVLSVGVSAGPIAGVGFLVLGLFWIYVTVQGWLAARRRQWSEHRRWMIRSFALTFAAVTLRLYLPVAVIGAANGLDFLIMYRAIAWLAWVPNAFAAELYLKRTKKIAVTQSGRSATIGSGPI